MDWDEEAYLAAQAEAQCVSFLTFSRDLWVLLTKCWSGLRELLKRHMGWWYGYRDARREEEVNLHGRGNGRRGRGTRGPRAPS